ncbi:P-loop containing nucleoside triphosphate hydrolase protein [Fistulina hepatica ATCC 64428]|uniref:p-loop containing nucleoside triphosphate hydrolase protein n=1 Tax=Fistulina hepatica ATCC 64428 TaxID=1128425 RepID=A0A0D7A3A9_9AGAR|nr:P-loop containing nucleoside triphosphate hydrolase protein [Fistulina hepatica ATCC 64428]
MGSRGSQSPGRPSAGAHAEKHKRKSEDLSSALSSSNKRLRTTRGNAVVKSPFQAVAPLAERLRPQSLDDFVGQTHLTAPDSLLMSSLRHGSTGSMIFWGPPGCGKTTLARLLAKHTNSIFKELSATGVGINDIRNVVDGAKNDLVLTKRKTILFLDEIHRFNRGQQDVFLPFVEQGIIQLVGATTENPSFKIIPPLLSRCRVYLLNRLTDDDIATILEKALSHATSKSPFAHVTPKVKAKLVSLSAGDARIALTLLDLAMRAREIPESVLIDSIRQSAVVSYDRTGEDHYDMISALHKSIRGSNGSAAMYWLARMLEAGEDPGFIARRLVVCSSEDVGLADPKALPLAMATLQACQIIGMPECRINLAHCVAYLSEAPKSTRAYEAYNRAVELAKSNPVLPVPLVMRNAPTKLMKDIGYGREYHYNPSYA